ncbi:hypothetical protein GCM10011428_45900 [Streptomyces violaceus]
MHTDRTSSTRFARTRRRRPARRRLATRTLGHQAGRILGRRPPRPRLTRRPPAHRLPAAVEAWAEFGGLHIAPTGPGRQVAPATLHLDPLHGLHMARTLGDLGRALGTQVCPLGAETDNQSLLAIDTDGRVYTLDHTGDWYLGQDIDQALSTLIAGTEPTRLTAS